VALFQPSLTPITIFEYAPMSLIEGVPESCPVLLLKVAHDGLLLIAKTKVRRELVLADGVNEYGCPTVTLLADQPEIVTSSCQCADPPAYAALTAHHVTAATIALRCRRSVVCLQDCERAIMPPQQSSGQARPDQIA
jgi:hypothetical protein